MAQLGWVIDLGLCTGCHACSVACKAENNTEPQAGPLVIRNGRPVGMNWRRVITREAGTYPAVTRQFITMACHHCEHPACLASCPTKAITKRTTDGVVQIDQARCMGCKYCVWACPYGAPQFNEATNKVEKCTLCVHRLDAGLQPACVTTCTGRALRLETFNFANSGQNAPSDFAEANMTHPAIRFET